MLPVHLIINPAAGRGRAAKVLTEVVADLESRGVTFRVSETKSLDHARSLAADASAAGEIAAAIGGDGLVGAVASATSKSSGLLAIIPGGRGNDLARVLGIPTDPAGSVGVLCGGRESTIDLGEAEGADFCCIASCGYDSDANRIANEARLPGSIVYLYAALRALISWRPANFRVWLDGEETSFRGYSVAVANSKAYGGGMFVAPDADLTDGLFDVVTISEGSKLRFLLRLPLVFNGKHTRAASVDVRRASTVRIEADRPFTVFADGDPICELPATIKVRRDAVRVLLPR